MSYDVLKEREKRRVQILTALGKLIEALEYDGVMGPGNIRLSKFTMGSHELIIPIQAGDRFLWEEILYDGT